MSSKVPVAKERLDRLLVSQGLLTSRESAVRTILAGGVLVDGTVVDKPARLVPRGARIEIERPAPFVSRSGEKLAAGLETQGDESDSTSVAPPVDLPIVSSNAE
jgi:23S rRNA (cytidine1920-2'-O)/16S rRNA (cytidine1409-2'-O)-methyltransferase